MFVYRQAKVKPIKNREEFFNGDDAELLVKYFEVLFLFKVLIKISKSLKFQSFLSQVSW